jgi:hypothetical protein
MRLFVHETNLRNKKIMRLIQKIAALHIQARVCQEIFFARNINPFKKCETKRG